MEPTQEIESRILALIRIKQNWYKYHGILQVQFFTNEATRQIFTIIQEFFKKYDSDKLTTGSMRAIVAKAITDEDLRDSCLLIIRKIRRLPFDDSKFAENLIKDFAKRQLVKIAITEGINLLETPDPDFSTIKEHIDKALNLSTETENDAYTYFTNPENRIESEKHEKKVSTGIGRLDETLRGGMSAGELLVFLGPPGRGKTLCLINMGVGAMLQGLCVFHATLEISDRKVARRYDARIANADFDSLMQNPDRLLPHLNKLKKNGAELVIRDYSMDSPKISDIYGAILKHEQRLKRKVDVLIVDYGDLLHPAKAYKDSRFGLEEVYTDLRRLGVKLGIPVYTASQTTRQSLSKNIIDMQDVAESFGKVKVADVILGICQSPEEEEENLVRFFVAKSRKANGHPSIRLEMVPNKMYLGEMDSTNTPMGQKIGSLKKNF